jgi:drug/metabolite transporter (DMT)-like permease
MEMGNAGQAVKSVLKATRRPATARAKGINAALASAIFLGMTPVFGKLAIQGGLSPLAVVAMRTTAAAILLFLVMLAFKRSYIYIYPAGLLGCALAGGINGLGSLLFYTSLGRINASLGQIIYSLYPLFVAVWLWLDHEKPSRLTVFRLLLVLPALYLLIGPQEIDILGVILMLGSAALYALHLPINQRVLYDMPAPTVTLYTLLAMSIVVVSAFGITTLMGKTYAIPQPQAWNALMGLTLVTFLSRLTLFTGVKHLGGLQTALLGLGELLVTIVMSHLWLHERLTIAQWMGVALLVVSLWMVLLEKQVPRRMYTGGWLSWLRPPGLPKDFPWNPQ